MSTARYVIPDEPLASGLSRWAVDPMWPMFGLMLGGLWLALPWFVFNGLALGTPTRVREWLTLAAGLVGAIVVTLAVAHAATVGWIAGVEIRLALLSVIAVKLAMGYAVYVMQSRSFELWQHFGGVARNGLLLVVAAFFVERLLFEAIGNVIVLLVLG